MKKSKKSLFRFNLFISDAITWYQRMMKYNSETREFDTKVTHHEAKDLSDIVSARIQHIPKGIAFTHH